MKILQDLVVGDGCPDAIMARGCYHDEISGIASVEVTHSTSPLAGDFFLCLVLLEQIAEGLLMVPSEIERGQNCEEEEAVTNYARYNAPPSIIHSSPRR